MKSMLKHIASPQFISEYLISDSLVLLEMEKKTVNFNKPIYTGKFYFNFRIHYT